MKTTLFLMNFSSLIYSGTSAGGNISFAADRSKQILEGRPRAMLNRHMDQIATLNRPDDGSSPFKKLLQLAKHDQNGESNDIAKLEQNIQPRIDAFYRQPVE